ncbi:VCBS repeat-containing protein [Streptomyces sp. NPDC000618]|uniref:FG-GAP repeat domain-containing protein n=1 Tax=Streptomyces sp. NPDC000618 TaxID=3154265 RepID=UPI003319A232
MGSAVLGVLSPAHADSAVAKGDAQRAAGATASVLPNARFVLAGFGLANSWRVDRHPRFMADITGDGRADIVGFGDTEVQTAVARGDGTFALAGGTAGLGYGNGWRVGRHPRFVTDVTGDGRADIIAIGDDGVYTAISRGDGTFGPAQFALNAFGANTRLPSEFFTGDVNGDGRTDLIGISDRRVDIALAQGNGGFAAPILATTEFTTVISTFSNFRVVDVTGDGRAEILAVKFDTSAHIVSASPRNDGTYAASRRAQTNATSAFQLMDAVTDVTGDGRADIVAFGQTEPQSYVAVSNGDGTFADFRVASNDFGAGAGWRGDRPEFVADITGDRRGDIVGFGTDGVWTANALGNGTFGTPQRVVTDLGFDQGWRNAQHPRLVADITGDGRADLIGFGQAGVYTAVALGDGSFG